MKKTLILTAVITMLSSTVVVASEQHETPLMSAAKVKQADLNHDRKVTKMEFLKAYAPSYASLMIANAEKEFKKLDVNKDGVISSKDYH